MRHLADQKDHKLNKLFAVSETHTYTLPRILQVPIIARENCLNPLCLIVNTFALSLSKCRQEAVFHNSRTYIIQYTYIYACSMQLPVRVRMTGGSVIMVFEDISPSRSG